MILYISKWSLTDKKISLPLHQAKDLPPLIFSFFKPSSIVQWMNSELFLGISTKIVQMCLPFPSSKRCTQFQLLLGPRKQSSPGVETPTFSSTWWIASYLLSCNYCTVKSKVLICLQDHSCAYPTNRNKRSCTLESFSPSKMSNYLRTNALA